jgi:type IV secretion system protein VirB5
MKRVLRISAIALGASLTAGTCQAQGIPVIDIANLIQSVMQVLNDVTKIENQVTQIQQLQNQVAAIIGSRNLGTVFDSPALKNYVPPDAYTAINAVDSSGYSALTPTARTLRDAGMVYNCLDLTGAARTNCQATLAQPYQQKGLLQDAMHAAAARLSQISSLMSQVDATTDQKAVLEIQARIGAENAMLGHEMSQIQMLGSMADSEERIARSRDRERQYETLTRTGKISDYLH